MKRRSLNSTSIGRIERASCRRGACACRRAARGRRGASARRGSRPCSGACARPTVTPTCTACSVDPERRAPATTSWPRSRFRPASASGVTITTRELVAVEPAADRICRQHVAQPLARRPPGTGRRRSCPSASLMSFRPSRSMKASVTVCSAARSASAASISSIILRWLGSRVSMSSCASVHARFSLWPRSRDRAADLPQRKPGKADQAEPGQREQRLELPQRRRHGAFRLPTEPADDAALRVEHRLHLAAAAGGLGLEAQVLEAGGALQAADHGADRASEKSTPDARMSWTAASSAPRRSSAWRSSAWRTST